MLAQRLSSSAIAVSLESKEIDDLQTRFASEKDRSVMASATVAELVYSHRERLQAALKEEQTLLAAIYEDSTGDRGLERCFLCWPRRTRILPFAKS